MAREIASQPAFTRRRFIRDGLLFGLASTFPKELEIKPPQKEIYLSNEFQMNNRWGHNKKTLPLGNGCIYYQTFNNEPTHRFQVIKPDTSDKPLIGRPLDMPFGRDDYMEQPIFAFDPNTGNILMINNRSQMGKFVPPEILLLKENGQELKPEASYVLTPSPNTVALEFRYGQPEFIPEGPDFQFITPIYRITKEDEHYHLYPQLCHIKVGSENEFELDYVNIETPPEAVNGQFNPDRILYLGNNRVFCIDISGVGICDIQTGKLDSYIPLPESWREEAYMPYGRPQPFISDKKRPQPFISDNKVVFFLKGKEENEGKVALLEFDVKRGEMKITPLDLSNKNVFFFWAHPLKDNDIMIIFSEGGLSKYDNYMDLSACRLNDVDSQWLPGEKIKVAQNAFSLSGHSAVAGSLGNGQTLVSYTIEGVSGTLGRLITPDFQLPRRHEINIPHILNILGEG